jgi:hypothetical protein
VGKGPQSPNNAQRKQERRALLSFALYRWESAAILALTLILVVLVPDPFGGALLAWRWWFWLILGLGAELLIVASTVLDADVRAKLASDRWRAQIAPPAISNVDYRQIADRAVRHQAEMELLRQRTRRQSQRERLRPITDEVSGWAAAIVRLAERLDDYPDPNKVPVQAESTLQDSLAALQTTYARLQLITAQGLDERRIRGLRGEIAAQTRVLQEMMENLP